MYIASVINKKIIMSKIHLERTNTKTHPSFLKDPFACGIEYDKVKDYTSNIEYVTCKKCLSKNN